MNKTFLGIALTATLLSGDANRKITFDDCKIQSIEVLKQIDNINEGVTSLLWGDDYIFIKPFVASKKISFKYTVGAEGGNNFVIFLGGNKLTIDEFKEYIHINIAQSIEYNPNAKNAILSLYNGKEVPELVKDVSHVDFIFDPELIKPVEYEAYFPEVYNTSNYDNDKEGSKKGKKEEGLSAFLGLGGEDSRFAKGASVLGQNRPKK